MTKMRIMEGLELCLAKMSEWDTNAAQRMTNTNLADQGHLESTVRHGEFVEMMSMSDELMRS
jgi:hypothetical protein